MRIESMTVGALRQQTALLDARMAVILPNGDRISDCWAWTQEEGRPFDVFCMRVGAGHFDIAELRRSTARVPASYPMMSSDWQARLRTYRAILDVRVENERLLLVQGPKLDIPEGA